MSANTEKVDEAKDHVEKALAVLEEITGDEGIDVEGVRKMLDGLADMLDSIAIAMGDERPEGDNGEDDADVKDGEAKEAEDVG